MQHILAPHPDDEVIGCYDILSQYNPEDIEIVYFNTSTITNDRYNRIRDFCIYYGFKHGSIIGNIIESLSKYMSRLDSSDVLHAPDPFHELHPFHKKIGSIVYYGRNNCEMNTCFYSTNMNAPYTYEVKTPASKKLMMDEFYDDQRSLWEYDHKYFLFEGHVRYLKPEEL